MTVYVRRYECGKPYGTGRKIEAETLEEAVRIAKEECSGKPGTYCIMDLFGEVLEIFHIYRQEEQNGGGAG